MWPQTRLATWLACVAIFSVASSVTGWDDDEKQPDNLARVDLTRSRQVANYNRFAYCASSRNAEVIALACPQACAVVWVNQGAATAFSPLKCRSVQDIIGMGISDSGRTLVVTDNQEEGFIRIFDFGTYQQTHKFGTGAHCPTSIVFSKDETTIWTTSVDGPITEWDVAKRAVRREFAGHRGGSTRLSIDSDNKTLASGGEDGRVNIWRLSDASQVLSIRAHKTFISNLVMTADGKHVIACAGGGAMGVWRTTDGRCISSEPAKSAGVCALSPDEKTLLGATSDGRILLWNFDSGLSQRREVHHSKVGITAVSFCGKGQDIAYCTDKGECFVAPFVRVKADQ